MVVPVAFGHVVYIGVMPQEGDNSSDEGGEWSEQVADGVHGVVRFVSLGF